MPVGPYQQLITSNDPAGSNQNYANYTPAPLQLKTIDDASVDKEAQVQAAPMYSKLRRALMHVSTVAANEDNPAIKREMLRSAMEGIGAGFSDASLAAHKAALAKEEKNVDSQNQGLLATYQAETTRGLQANKIAADERLQTLTLAEARAAQERGITAEQALEEKREAAAKLLQETSIASQEKMQGLTIAEQQRAQERGITAEQALEAKRIQAQSELQKESLSTQYNLQKASIASQEKMQQSGFAYSQKLQKQTVAGDIVKEILQASGGTLSASEINKQTNTWMAAYNNALNNFYSLNYG